MSFRHAAVMLVLLLSAWAAMACGPAEADECLPADERYRLLLAGVAAVGFLALRRRD